MLRMPPEATVARLLGFLQLSLLPPGRRQRLRTTRLTRRIQRLDSRTVSLFVRMVITLGHRHRLMAGEVPARWGRRGRAFV
jgi:hypothetical protein